MVSSLAIYYQCSTIVLTYKENKKKNCNVFFQKKNLKTRNCSTTL